MAANNEQLTFEKSLAELEKIVKAMEEGSLSLEDSLKHFEHGIALIKQCQNAITSAEAKVKILLGDNNDATLQDYKEAG